MYRRSCLVSLQTTHHRVASAVRTYKSLLISEQRDLYPNNMQHSRSPANLPFLLLVAHTLSSSFGEQELAQTHTYVERRINLKSCLHRLQGTRTSHDLQMGCARKSAKLAQATKAGNLPSLPSLSRIAVTFHPAKASLCLCDRSRGVAPELLRTRRDRLSGADARMLLS